MERTGTKESLATEAARLNVNPYYHGYAILTGAASCQDAFKRDGGNHLYFAWNGKLWSDQAKAEGVSRDYVAILPGAVERHIALIETLIASTALAQPTH